MCHIGNENLFNNQFLALNRESVKLKNKSSVPEVWHIFAIDNIRVRYSCCQIKT